MHEGFTKKYNIDKLVYFESHNYINLAIAREKHIKKWLRKWKLKLIEDFNPNWNDLFYEIGGKDDMFDEYFESTKETDSRIRENDKDNGKSI